MFGRRSNRLGQPDRTCFEPQTWNLSTIAPLAGRSLSTTHLIFFEPLIMLRKIFSFRCCVQARGLTQPELLTSRYPCI